MSLTPQQEDVLREIADRIATSDPALGRRLSRALRTRVPRRRPTLVLAVVLVEVVAGFLPVVAGLALASPLLIGFGVITTLGTAMGAEATLAWVRRQREARTP